MTPKDSLWGRVSIETSSGQLFSVGLFFGHCHSFWGRKIAISWVNSADDFSRKLLAADVGTVTLDKRLLFREVGCAKRKGKKLQNRFWWL